MTLGRPNAKASWGNVAVARCEAELPQASVYRLLHAERDGLFGDELFADLYVHHGRRSVARDPVDELPVVMPASAPPGLLEATATPAVPRAVATRRDAVSGCGDRRRRFGSPEP
jgi:hypothetical protein